jgi:outer membrane lipoprotein-sorting protein
MKRIIRQNTIFTVILFLLLMNNVAYPSDSPVIDLLKKAYTNQRLVIHNGMLKTVAFLGNETSTSIVEIRQKDGKVRIDYKSDIFAGLYIIDDGKKTMRVNVKNKTVIENSIPFPVSDISLLLNNYTVKPVGTEIIANRKTQVVQIVPKLKGNPSSKLWIDKKTFMPLRREYYNSDGVMTTSTYYMQINYNALIKDSDFLLPQGTSYTKSPQEMQRISKEEITEIFSFDLIEPKYIPFGYALDGFYLFYPRSGKGLHIRYTDGFNSISILEVMPPNKGHRFGRMRGWGRGNGMRYGQDNMQGCKFLDNYQGRVIRVFKDNLNIAIASDISEEELQKMADSVK